MANQPEEEQQRAIEEADDATPSEHCSETKSLHQRPAECRPCEKNVHLILIRLKIGSGDVPGMFIKEYWTTDPPSQQWDVTAMVSAFLSMKEFWFAPIVTTPNDLFSIIWECSYRQQSQRRKQRLQWHTPLHRLRCNFNLIWFWKKKDLVMEGKTKLFQKYFLTFIIFCFFFTCGECRQGCLALAS